MWERRKEILRVTNVGEKDWEWPMWEREWEKEMIGCILKQKQAQNQIELLIIWHTLPNCNELTS